MSLVRKVPTSGLGGFFSGIVVGFIVDKIAEYVYWNFGIKDQIPPESTPIFAIDDWMMVLVSLVLLFKKPSFGAGFFVGFLVGSSWFR